VYESHFSLADRPFREGLDADAFVALPSRVAALRRLAYGLEHIGGPALLYGATGTGKSLLARCLGASAPYRTIVMDYPALPVESLLAYLANELGDPPRRVPDGGPLDLHRTVRAVREALAASAARGARPLLIVDDAHLIADRRALDALRLLLNFDSGGGPDLALVLVGEPELVLDLPAALADRVSARCLLRPLDLAEAGDYLAGRLARVGGAAALFEGDAVAALHAASEGLPRRLNRLADLALLVAASEGRDRVDAPLIARLAADELPDAIAA
jgi:type II secretory pathway predicted ATPase ExeA